MRVLIPAGECQVGSDRHYPEERPAHRVHLDAFEMSVAPVTVAQFGAFVADSGWQTVAEQPPPSYDGVDAALLVPGSVVFTPPPGPVDLADARQWWSWVPGACWSAPGGPGTTASPDHPVVHVALTDALAYADWAGEALPTEAQWERAARGGLDGAVYAWGDELAPDGVVPATVWQGSFPWDDRSPGGAGTTPVGSHPPNGFGLVDVIGNVWEWTTDPWQGRHVTGGCCPVDDPAAPGVALHVAKGGSFLCSPEHCARYRPAARTPMAADSGALHLGIRTCLPHAGA